MSEQGKGISQDVDPGNPHVYNPNLWYQVHAHGSVLGLILGPGYGSGSSAMLAALPCIQSVSPVNVGTCYYYDGYGWYGSACPLAILAEPSSYMITFSCYTETNLFYYVDGFVVPSICANTYSGGYNQSEDYGIDTKIHTFPAGLTQGGSASCAYYRWGGMTAAPSDIYTCGGEPYAFIGIGVSAALIGGNWHGTLTEITHGELYCVKFGVEEYVPGWEHANPYSVEISNIENQTVVDDAAQVWAVAARGTQFVCAGATINCPGEEGTTVPVNQVHTDFISIGAPIMRETDWHNGKGTPIVAIKPRQDLIYDTPYLPEGDADPDVYDDPLLTGQVTNVFYQGFYIGFTVARTSWQCAFMHRYWFSWKVYMPLEYIALNGRLPYDDEYGFQFFGSDVSAGSNNMTQYMFGRWNHLFYDSRVEPFDVVQMTMVSNAMGSSPAGEATIFQFDEQIGVASDYETHAFFLQEPISYNTMYAKATTGEYMHMHTFATAEGIMRAATISGYSGYNFEKAWEAIGGDFGSNEWDFPFTTSNGTLVESYADANTKFLMSPIVPFGKVETTFHSPHGSGNCANGNQYALGLDGNISVHAGHYNSSMMAVRPTTEDYTCTNAARYARTGSLTNMNNFSNGIFGTWMANDAIWGCGIGTDLYGQGNDYCLALVITAPLYDPGNNSGTVTSAGGIKGLIIRFSSGCGSISSHALIVGNAVCGAWTRRDNPEGSILVSGICPASCGLGGEDLHVLCSGLVGAYGCGGIIDGQPCYPIPSCYPQNPHPDDGGNLTAWADEGGSFPYNFVFRTVFNSGGPTYYMLVNFNEGVPSSADYVLIESPEVMASNNHGESEYNLGLMVGCGTLQKS